MATSPSSNAVSAYDLVVKALQDKIAAEAALAQAQSEIEDLKKTITDAREASDAADDREYRLMDDFREMKKNASDRGAHIRQVYAVLESIAEDWAEHRKDVLKCVQCDNTATVRYMDCGHTLCTRTCGDKICANCLMPLHMTWAACDNHVWDRICPVEDCSTAATTVVPLTGSQAATALSGLRLYLNQVVDYVNDQAGEIRFLEEEHDRRMEDD